MGKQDSTQVYRFLRQVTFPLLFVQLAIFLLFRSFEAAIKSLSEISGLSPITNIIIAPGVEVCSVNMFANSKFGESILANVSLDKISDHISGHVRIRSKSNSIVYLLGNKISKFIGTE